jgi:hypothetical protein
MSISSRTEKVLSKKSYLHAEKVMGRKKQQMIKIDDGIYST